MAFDPSNVRRQFPLLMQEEVVYLDYAATTQKPQCVLDAMDEYYKRDNANAHRGMHILSERATIQYEKSRAAVQHFLNAFRPEEIIFTKSCTEALNLVAKSWGKMNLKKDDVIVLSILEHHSNIVPWLQLKQEIGIEIKWIEIDEDGTLQMEMLDQFIAEGNVKMISITGQSNVLGVRPPLEEIIKKAHAAGALVCVDAAQLVAHHLIDVQKLDCDFLAFSGHKLYGPNGIGVLYGKKDLLQNMPPMIGGGMMIEEVTRDDFTSADIPGRFEGGTPPVAEAVGLRSAIEWLKQFDWEEIEKHEKELMEYASEKLNKIDGLKMLPHSSGCISFIIDEIHPHDLTEIIGREGVCLRAGHHCTQPLHEFYLYGATSRISIGIYNTKEDIDLCVSAIELVYEKMRT